MAGALHRRFPACIRQATYRRCVSAGMGPAGRLPDGILNESARFRTGEKSSARRQAGTGKSGRAERARSKLKPACKREKVSWWA